jgi:alpha-galactosidase
MIHFDPAEKTFGLSGANSVYLLRVTPHGTIEHLGFSSAPSALPQDWAKSLPPRSVEHVWDSQGVKCEYPAFGDVSYHDVALKVSFPRSACMDPATESPNVPVRDVRLRYVSHEIGDVGAPGFSPAHGLPVRNTTPREGLVLRLKDELYDFHVSLFYRLSPEFDILERWVELDNRCAFPIEIDRLDFASLALDSKHWEITRASGSWGREFQIERHVLLPGSHVWGSQGLNTGHATNPFFFLNAAGGASESSGEVIFGALSYSGNWELRAEVQELDGVRLFGGYHSLDFRMELLPGQSHRTPAMVLGVSSDGWSGASQQLHGWAQDYVLPRPPLHPSHRPVLYNSWEVCYFDVNEEQQIALARRAAEIGVELYCIDDGWFGSRRDDRAGLGDWVVSKQSLPRGLKPIIDEVRRLGMAFGLWVEPEMVNPDSDLYRAHPDWVLHFPGRSRTESRHQLVLDFGRPEVVAHILDALDMLLRDNAIDFFKWDMNRYATEPGSVAGRQVWQKHVEGVYRIMDELRRRHSHLAIQSCSGGGGRVDFGMMGRVDQFWASDNTDARHRIVVQEGYSLAYPARTMECWVTHERNHQTGSTLPLSLRFDCAMLGALGIGTPLDKISSEELNEYKKRIAFYKSIRPVIQDGRLYRLERTEERGVSTWQYVEEGARRSVLSLLAYQCTFLSIPPRLRLRGLDPTAIYCLTDYTGREIGRATGWNLMTVGTSSVGGGVGSEYASETILLEACSPG